MREMQLPIRQALKRVACERSLAFGGIFVAMLVSMVLVEDARLMAWVAFCTAACALFTAAFALRKIGKLQFCPQVLGGDVILPRRGEGENARLLLPLQFSNAGLEDGLVEWLAVRLTRDGDHRRSVLLSPVGEVDMPRFIGQKRKITAENTIEPFTGFPLEGRRALAKFVLFDVAERPRADPLEVRAGRYTFELFIKASNARQPRLERTFEHVVEEKHLDEWRNASALYLINYHITLPAMRRALADCEWLPAGEPQDSAR
jgi:hypothetical protein